MELREVRGRLLSSDSAPGHSANYGAVNPGFTKDDAVTNLVSEVTGTKFKIRVIADACTLNGDCTWIPAERNGCWNK